MSGDFFNVLGVRPAVGRLFSSADDQPGCGASGVVVSYAFWRDELGRDPHAVGRTLTIGRHPVPIVGVTRAGFTGPEIGHSFDVAVPICCRPILDPRQLAGVKHRLVADGDGTFETRRFLIHSECGSQILFAGCL